MTPLQQISTTLDALLATGNVVVSFTEFFVALALSFVLSLVIGTVYQRTYRGSRYTQDYVHTLVLMGMVVSVVIMVVGDNLARAFGIFAAFSIIRFRRALPEARDVGFIFFAMAVGLTAGAREYPFAILTTVLVCAAVLLISRLDLFAPPAATHALRFRAPADLDPEAVAAEVFARMVDRAALLEVRTPKAGRQLELRYEIHLRPDVDPSDLVAELQARSPGGKVVLRSVLPPKVR